MWDTLSKLLGFYFLKHTFRERISCMFTEIKISIKHWEWQQKLEPWRKVSEVLLVFYWVTCRFFPPLQRMALISNQIHRQRKQSGLWTSLPRSATQPLRGPPQVWCSSLFTCGHIHLFIRHLNNMTSYRFLQTLLICLIELIVLLCITYGNKLMMTKYYCVILVANGQNVDERLKAARERREQHQKILGMSALTSI